MREIKFRCFDKLSLKMYTRHSLTITANGAINYLDTDGQWKEFDNDERIVVMQYTGLKDKNGKEIWEGDVIRWDNRDKPEQIMHSTDWDGRIDQFTAPFMSAWGSTCGRYYKTFMNVFDPARFATVIGNIYDNPELLSNSQ